MKYILYYLNLSLLFMACSQAQPQPTEDMHLNVSQATAERTSTPQDIILKVFRRESVEQLVFYPVEGLADQTMIVFQADLGAAFGIGILTGSTVGNQFFVKDLWWTKYQKPLQDLYIWELSTAQGNGSYVGYVWVPDAHQGMLVKVFLTDGSVIYFDNAHVHGFVFPRTNPPVQIDILDAEGTILTSEPVQVP